MKGKEETKRGIYPKTCLAIFLIFWVWLAISPYNRRDWALENILVVGAAIVIIASYRRIRLSNFSYTLLTIFLILHLFGAHYTYSKVPWFAAIQELLGQERNHYDRLLHFLFGLLCYIPIKEWTDRKAGSRGAWSYFVPILIIAFMGSTYEIAEFAVAQTLNPDIGLAFVGAQGDVWDAEKDMGLALIGGLITLTLLALWKKYKFYRDERDVKESLA